MIAVRVSVGECTDSAFIALRSGDFYFCFAMSGRPAVI